MFNRPSDWYVVVGLLAKVIIYGAGVVGILSAARPRAAAINSIFLI